MRELIGLCLLSGLVACGSDTADQAQDIAEGKARGIPICHYIAGGLTSTVVTNACALCTVTNESAAVDGNPRTYATLVFPALSEGTLALRVQAQEGVVFPAGSNAGAIMSTRSEAPEYLSSGPDLRTYYMGTPVGSNNVGSVNVIGGGGNGSPQRVFVSSPVMYDGVELGFTRGGSTGETQIRIHEFCSE